MWQNHGYFSGLRLLCSRLLVCAVVTGCNYEAYRGEAGRGYALGVAVTPAAALIVALSAALLGYVVWRRTSKP